MSLTEIFMNSRNKGASGERELANKLKEYGYDARRGQQYCGANENEKPAVFHRKNRCEWLVTMRLDDWIELYREWANGYCETDTNRQK